MKLYNWKDYRSLRRKRNNSLHYSS